MRKAWVRVEQRLDETIAVRLQDQYVRVRRCAHPVGEAKPVAAIVETPKPKAQARPKSTWMNSFSLRSGPSLRQAIGISNARN
jgi:hypothetical protein